MYTVHIAPCPGTSHLHETRDDMSCREFPSLREAVLWARAGAQHGSAVACIIGSDGAYLSRSDLVAAITPTLWSADDELEQARVETAAARHIHGTACKA